MNKFFCKARSTCFWILDYLKGKPIKRQLDDIEHTFSLGSFSQIKEKNNEALHRLLSKVTLESPFYQDYRHYGSLKDFPIVDKNVITQNFEDFQTKSSKGKKLHRMYTSGSTGTPFMILQNQEKRKRNIADTIFYANLAGFSIGQKLLYLRQWDNKLKKNKLLSWLQNIDPIDVEDLGKPGFIDDLIKRLTADKSPKGWLGYPSGLEKICDYLDSIKSEPMDCNVKSIIGMSESLSTDIRNRMSYYFEVDMVSRYSNFENGILAQQYKQSEYFVINWASYIIEILDFDKDTAVKDGELGRIVVTDLYNHAIPLIRYDTGDIGAFCEEFVEDFPFPVLKTVEGRKADILYDTKGEVTSPFKFMGIVPEYPEVSQMQFIQTGNQHYTIKLNIENRFKREAELVAYVKSILGNDAQVTVAYVNEIPLLKSKKRKITRNLISEEEKQPAVQNSLTM